MRYLKLSAEQWEALSWDLQETYLNGLAEDPNVPFNFSEEGPPASWQQDSGTGPGMPAPQIRRVDTGAKVFDIKGMIAELEANPAARKRT